MTDKIKQVYYDCLTGIETYEYFTEDEWEEELIRREKYEKTQEELEKNKPLTIEEKYEQLEQAMLETTALLALEQEKNKQNEQAILELSMLAIQGGN